MSSIILSGDVIRDGLDKTVKVCVKRSIFCPRYRKILHRSKNYLAHDEFDKYSVGDRVLIKSTRPFSSNKKWCVL